MSTGTRSRANRVETPGVLSGKPGKESSAKNLQNENVEKAKERSSSAGKKPSYAEVLTRIGRRGVKAVGVADAVESESESSVEKEDDGAVELSKDEGKEVVVEQVMTTVDAESLSKLSCNALYRMARVESLKKLTSTEAKAVLQAYSLSKKKKKARKTAREAALKQRKGGTETVPKKRSGSSTSGSFYLGKSRKKLKKTDDNHDDDITSFYSPYNTQVESSDADTPMREMDEVEGQAATQDTPKGVTSFLGAETFSADDIGRDSYEAEIEKGNNRFRAKNGSNQRFRAEMQREWYENELQALRRERLRLARGNGNGLRRVAGLTKEEERQREDERNAAFFREQHERLEEQETEERQLRQERLLNYRETVSDNHLEHQSSSDRAGQQQKDERLDDSDLSSYGQRRAPDQQWRCAGKEGLCADQDQYTSRRPLKFSQPRTDDSFFEDDEKAGERQEAVERDGLDNYGHEIQAHPSGNGERTIREEDGRRQDRNEGKMGDSDLVFQDKDGRIRDLVGVSKVSVAMGDIADQLALARLIDPKRFNSLVDKGKSTVLDFNSFRKLFVRQFNDDGPQDAFWGDEVIPWSMVPHFNELFGCEATFAGFCKMEFDSMEKGHVDLVRVFAMGKETQNLSIRDVSTILAELEDVLAMVMSTEAGGVFRRLQKEISGLRDAVTSGAFVMVAVTRALVKTVEVMRRTHLKGAVLVDHEVYDKRRMRQLVAAPTNFRSNAWCWELFERLIFKFTDLSLERSLIYSVAEGRKRERLLSRESRAVEPRALGLSDRSGPTAEGNGGGVRAEGRASSEGPVSILRDNTRPCVARCVQEAFPDLMISCNGQGCQYEHDLKVTKAVTDDLDRFTKAVEIVRGGPVHANRLTILARIGEGRK